MESTLEIPCAKASREMLLELIEQDVARYKKTGEDRIIEFRRLLNEAIQNRRFDVEMQNYGTHLDIEFAAALREQGYRVDVSHKTVRITFC